MKSLIKILLTLFLSILLIGCGSRKVKKSIETEKKTETETVKTNEVKTDNTKINVSEVFDETIIEPIDTVAPMIVNGKTYKNARLRHRNKKVNTIVIKDIKEVKTIVKQAKKSNLKEVIKKDIKKTSFSFWWWLLLLIIPIYYLYRKYKNLIWFI
jgi:hypothetical protein